MLKKGLWLLFGILAILVGLYPGIYLLHDKKFGLLTSKSDELLANTLWNMGFYTHIFLGGLALLIGWTQFIPAIRKNYVKVHRTIGKIYVSAVLLSATAGICIGFFASGGLIPSLGFICLGITWFYSTLRAYLLIRKGFVQNHQHWMIFSYAACFGAVTLRIWLPFLMMYFGDFQTAYSIVAWLSWIPNMVVAYFITRKITTSETKRVVLP